MKNIWVTLIFCISIFSTPASFASDNHDEHTAHQDQTSFADRKYKERKSHSSDAHRSEHKHRHHAARQNWQAGTTLPDEYLHTGKQIDHSQYARLSKPTKYQQWRKVNDQYVLMNVLTNTIIKVVPEKQKSDH